MVYAANTTAATATNAATTTAAVATTGATIAAAATASSNRSWHQIADHRAHRHHPHSGHDVHGCWGSTLPRRVPSARVSDL